MGSKIGKIGAEMEQTNRIAGKADDRRKKENDEGNEDADKNMKGWQEGMYNEQNRSNTDKSPNPAPIPDPLRPFAVMSPSRMVML
jgi:hypothetical protein